MEYVKCAQCGENTEVRADLPHGGLFFCEMHEPKNEVYCAQGSGPIPEGWVRSDYQARLDQGRSISEDGINGR